jgi:hypothetical protein
MILYGSALLAALARASIRLYYQKRLFIDDAILALAVVLLSASAGLYLSLVDDMYLAEALILGLTPPQTDQATIVQRLIRLHKLTDSFFILNWSSSSSVKFSFLFFFRSFIAHPGLESLGRYWWVVTIFTAISWVSGCILQVVACPYYDQRFCRSSPSLYFTVFR